MLHHQPTRFSPRDQVVSYVSLTEPATSCRVGVVEPPYLMSREIGGADEPRFHDAARGMVVLDADLDFF